MPDSRNDKNPATPLAIQTAALTIFAPPLLFANGILFADFSCTNGKVR